MSAARPTRVSPLRVLVLVVAALAVLVGAVAVVRPLVVPAAVVAEPVFTPYVDVTATPAYEFQTPRNQYGQDVTLAFVVADGPTSCEPSWGGAYSLAAAEDTLQLDRRIAALRANGGDVRVSFGGQAGTELAAACTDPAALASAYRAVVDRYDLTSIDLDVEGAGLADSATSSRRAAAVATLQAQRPVAVWLTLPTTPQGLTDQGVAALDALLAAGVDVSGVNAMTFDFGASKDAGTSTVDAVTAAATAVQGQVRAAWSRAGTAIGADEAWARTGVTVMIGQTDVASERLTIADAEAVNTFARTAGVGQVSMWSLNRDATCGYPLPDVVVVVQTSCSGVDQQGRSFAETLGDGLQDVVRATSSATPSATAPPATPTASATDDPATSPFPVWDPLTVYVAGTKTVWHHRVYQAAFYTTGIPPDAVAEPGSGTPWKLLGPVLPGETPAPAPSVPVGTYPQWDGATAYVAGEHVQVGTVPYVARFWTKGDRPGVPMVGGSPWTVVGTSG